MDLCDEIEIMEVGAAPREQFSEPCSNYSWGPLIPLLLSYHSHASPTPNHPLVYEAFGRRPLSPIMCFPCMILKHRQHSITKGPVLLQTKAKTLALTHSHFIFSSHSFPKAMTLENWITWRKEKMINNSKIPFSQNWLVTAYFQFLFYTFQSILAVNTYSLSKIFNTFK